MKNKDHAQLIEEFEGVVDKVDGDLAFVTLTAKDTGETLLGEYPSAKLVELGIHERRRFRCRTVSCGEGVKVEMEPIPDREISKERERQIDEWLQKSLGDDCLEVTND